MQWKCKDFSKGQGSDVGEQASLKSNILNLSVGFCMFSCMDELVDSTGRSVFFSNLKLVKIA